MTDVPRVKTDSIKICLFGLARKRLVFIEEAIGITVSKSGVEKRVVFSPLPAQSVPYETKRAISGMKSAVVLIEEQTNRPSGGSIFRNFVRITFLLQRRYP